MKQCNIALYIRISNSDSDLNKDLLKSESDSIVSQRNFLNNLLDKNKQLSQCSRIEYVDDGFSGTSDDRPAFKEMIKNAENGEINIIIVRDMSRFFRDYIESGHYIETIFPLLKIRFISVNDNFDSDDYAQTAGNFELAIRNLVYASYSRDTSIKVKNSRIHMAKNGKYIGGHPPYGYKMHDTIKNKLAIDENSAKHVREIFDYALNGLAVKEICVKLNEQGVLTPMRYFRSINKNSKRYKSVSDDAKWSYGAVRSILNNIVYKGDLESHKFVKEDLYSKKIIKSEPIIVHGTHEAIIDSDNFKQAQLVIKKVDFSGHYKSHDYPLKSLVRCGNCKKILAKHKRDKRNYFSCKNHTLTLDENCKLIGISEEGLEEIVFNTIKSLIKQEKDGNKNNTKPVKSIKDVGKIVGTKNPEKELEKLKIRKFKLYERYANGKICKDIYLQKTDETNTLIDDISNKQENNYESYLNIDSHKNENKPYEHFKKDSLTYELAHGFVDSIYIYQDKKIEIKMKFKDIFLAD